MTDYVLTLLRNRDTIFIYWCPDSGRLKHQSFVKYVQIPYLIHYCCRWSWVKRMKWGAMTRLQLMAQRHVNKRRYIMERSHICTVNNNALVIYSARRFYSPRMKRCHLDLLQKHYLGFLCHDVRLTWSRKPEHVSANFFCPIGTECTIMHLVVTYKKYRVNSPIWGCAPTFPYK